MLVIIMLNTPPSDSIVATSPDVSCCAMAPGPGGHGYIAPFPFRPSSASSAPSRGDELITGTTEVHGGFIISTVIYIIQIKPM